MRGIQGKNSIVTGGAQGIGRACMEAFIGYGCSVVFSDLEDDTGTVTEAKLREQGAEASFITGTDLPVDCGYLGLGGEGVGEASIIPGWK